jgi:hypothetical protein
MSLSTAFTNASAGDDVYIKADGTYTRSASDTPANSGTAANPIRYIGYSSTITDGYLGRTNGNGALITTNMPSIAYNSTYALVDSAKVYIQWINLRISGTINGDLMRPDRATARINCVITNAGIGSSAVAAQVWNNGVDFINCDITASGSTALAAIRCSGVSPVFVHGCRLSCTNGACILAVGGAVVFSSFCTFSGSYGIDQTGTSTCYVKVVNPTAYAITNSFYRLPNNSAAVNMPSVLNGMITDSGRAFENAYSGTGNLPILRYNCRTRDNTNADTGFDDWPAISPITTDGGGAETDYTNAGSGDFSLISASPGKGVGIPNYLDCGAAQREESGGSTIIVIDD